MPGQASGADTTKLPSTKLTPEQMKSLNRTTAEALAEALAKGTTVHYIENGRIVEKRPDGSRAEYSGQFRLTCKYDSQQGNVSAIRK